MRRRSIHAYIYIGGGGGGGGQTVCVRERDFGPYLTSSDTYRFSRHRKYFIGAT